MQHALRPYASAGVAIVGASIIAITPVAAPLPELQTQPVRLVDAWSELVSNTTANLDAIVGHASSSDLTQLFDQFVTNPFGVIEAFANFDPTVTTELGTLPATISVELPPGLELAIAGFGATGATLTTLETVAQQLQTDPSLTNLSEGLATVLNAYLNGASDISLLDGAITIPLYNGLLAPEISGHFDINLVNLIDALGLGGTNVDLSSLLGQLGNISLSSLLTELGISGDKLGDLLAHLTTPITSLGGVLDLLGLDKLTLPSLDLTSILHGLGLDTSVDLNSLTLSDVLSDFGINSPLADLSNLSLSSILESFGVVLPSGATLGATTLTSLLGDLGLGNLGLGDLLQNVANSGVLGSTTTALLDTLLLGSKSLLNDVSLGTLVSGLTLGNGGSLSLDTLLGDLGINLPSSADLANIDISDVLTSLGVHLPGNLDLGTLLGELGFASGTGPLTLGDLLGDLSTVANPLLDLNVTGLLDNLTLGGLVNDLGLGNLELDLNNLIGDLPSLNLGNLLGDLGLADLASVSVGHLGGFDTLLVDVIPQQILTALGM